MPNTATAFLKSLLVYYVQLSVLSLSLEQSGFSTDTAFVIESITTCFIVERRQKVFAIFKNTRNIYSLKQLSPIVEKQHAELMYAYKKELSSKAKERMLAVFNVIEEDEAIPTIAQLFYKSYNTIKNWVM